MEPRSELEDAAFWERVRRARQMTPQERILEGFRLFEQYCEDMAAQIRREYPQLDEPQVQQLLTQRLELLRREEEEGRYITIEPPPS
jgi:hypothetical protein